MLTRFSLRLIQRGVHSMADRRNAGNHSVVLVTAPNMDVCKRIAQ